MQVVSTTDAAASARASAGRLARLDRPALAALTALAGWLVFVAARLAGWAHGQLSLFIASGTRYSHPALMFPRIAHVKGKGYKLSWAHLGTYDYNLIEFAVLGAFLVAGFLVLRATTAPVHERAAFAGFVIVEVVSASSQFWFSVFGEGRTYVDAYAMAVVLLLATPAEAAGQVHESLADCVFAEPGGQRQAPGRAGRRAGGGAGAGGPPAGPVRVSRLSGS